MSSGLIRKPSDPPPSEGGGELRVRKSALAEQLRQANTDGVTSWLGLSERLDVMVLIDVTAFRELLKMILTLKLSQASSGPGEEQKRMKAKSLLDALTAYETEAGRRKDEDAA